MNLTTSILVFIGCTLVILFAGTRLSRDADQLADITGIGEALMGAIFLGIITSLPGITTSVTAAFEGYPKLAVSNAVGGIAFQTFFLAIADISYPKANLEHASASLTNLLQSILLILLLAFILLVTFLPEFSIWAIHPASIILLMLHIGIQRMITGIRKDPMWSPVETRQTRPEISPVEESKRRKTGLIVIRFLIFAVLIIFAGYFIMRSAVHIARHSMLSESIIGAAFTAMATSLPELVVTISAVRHRALTLAVGNIIGGNTFDVLFISFSDFSYREGSILHVFDNSHYFIFVLTIILTSILALGLLHRQRHGFAGIGWESVLIILVFVAGYAGLFLLGG